MTRLLPLLIALLVPAAMAQAGGVPPPPTLIQHPDFFGFYNGSRCANGVSGQVCSGGYAQGSGQTYVTRPAFSVIGVDTPAGATPPTGGWLDPANIHSTAADCYFFPSGSNGISSIDAKAWPAAAYTYAYPAVMCDHASWNPGGSLTPAPIANYNFGMYGGTPIIFYNNASSSYTISNNWFADGGNLAANSDHSCCSNTGVSFINAINPASTPTLIVSRNTFDGKWNDPCCEVPYGGDKDHVPAGVQAISYGMCANGITVDHNAFLNMTNHSLAVGICTKSADKSAGVDLHGQLQRRRVL